MPRGHGDAENTSADVEIEATAEEPQAGAIEESQAEAAIAEAPAKTPAETPAESPEEPKTESSEEPTEIEGDETPSDDPVSAATGDGINWSRALVFGVLPALALLLAIAAGYLKWQDNRDDVTDITNANSVASQAMQAAKDSTIAMLSYKPESVDKQLNDARERLTGDFRDQYTGLINDVVIPGAKQKQISAVASVPGVGSVSADSTHAVVLLFVNQTVVVGQSPPTDSASSVRVTLDKIDGRWLISKFDPV